MSQRPPHDDETEYALWQSKPKAGRVDAHSVVIAHSDLCIGESIALLLRLKGFVAVSARDIESLELMIEHWKPRAMIIDTRLCLADDFQFVRRASADVAFKRVLIIAMTSRTVEESPRNMRAVGFDGLCRRPCPLWRLSDMLGGQLVSQEGGNSYM
nr:hypothetical protein HUO10_005383 [Paraburkholderia busanensis]